MHFTYLDLIDPTILFEPVMFNNWFDDGHNQYALFTENEDETKKNRIPGYEGKRCIIEIEMAKKLSFIQKILRTQGLALKVYDAYRPQKAVDFFTQWTKSCDTVFAKKAHYPHANKKDFHELSYLSQTSSHTLGTAVDVTLVSLDPSYQLSRAPSFLGFFDKESLDMGNVGYLCFDERSWSSYENLTLGQKNNRDCLSKVMTSNGFIPLETEFWHYYFMPERNKTEYFNFDIRDDYVVSDFILKTNEILELSA